MPRKGERMDVAAPALETLVKFEGTREKMVDAVTFRNVNFEVTTWNRPSYKGHVPLQEAGTEEASISTFSKQ